MMETLSEQDRQDMQALMARGFGHLPHSVFCLFSVKTPSQARPHLMNLLDELTPATQKPQQQALQMAFTCKGLDALGLPKKILATFSDAFRSGMDTPHKRRILGDVADSAPENWQWGGPSTAPVHLMLLCYADTADNMSAFVEQQVSTAEAAGLALVTQLPGEALAENREHFGFKDGLAQPYISEFDRHGTKGSTNAQDELPAVPLGEFVLGYRNGYDRYTQRPLISPESDSESVLPPALDDAEMRDLGRNGTYLVYRQLSQDVGQFWSYLLAQATVAVSESAGPGLSEDDAKIMAAEYVAAKMVGRWPNGVPLVKAPTKSESESLGELPAKALDDFRYHHEDQAGHRCPLGAHIRRANPRDSLDPEPGTQKSVDFSDRHRLLRRGRPYGAPVTAPLDVKTIMTKLLAKESLPEGERGLHFICLGANIQRQFEFVQYTWCTNPNFNGLYNDPDPLIGDRAPHGKTQDNFTIQHPFVRREVRGMPNFVQTQGGAYFFMPGKRALRYMLLNSE